MVRGSGPPVTVVTVRAAGSMVGDFVALSLVDTLTYYLVGPLSEFVGSRTFPPFCVEHARTNNTIHHRGSIYWGSVFFTVGSSDSMVKVLAYSVISQSQAIARPSSTRSGSCIVRGNIPVSSYLQ